MAKDDHPSTDKWTKEQTEEVMKRLGLEGVLNEPPSEMSKYYVTNTFTGYGDPLAPFRHAFKALADTDVRSLLEQASAEGVVDKDEPQKRDRREH